MWNHATLLEPLKDIKTAHALQLDETVVFQYKYNLRCNTLEVVKLKLLK